MRRLLGIVETTEEYIRAMQEAAERLKPLGS
jgi:hypothetical protein